MRLVRWSTTLSALVLIFAGVAFAQGYGSNYDWQSGNSYRWNTDSLGNTHVYGNNFNTGSQWNTTVQPNGDMRGLDSHFNTWNYNARTGSYMNSNGHGCVGHGFARTCW